MAWTPTQNIHFLNICSLCNLCNVIPTFKTWPNIYSAHKVVPLQFVFVLQVATGEKVSCWIPSPAPTHTHQSSQGIQLSACVGKCEVCRDVVASRVYCWSAWTWYTLQWAGCKKQIFAFTIWSNFRFECVHSWFCKFRDVVVFHAALYRQFTSALCVLILPFKLYLCTNKGVIQCFQSLKSCYCQNFCIFNFCIAKYHLNSCR